MSRSGGALCITVCAAMDYTIKNLTAPDGLQVLVFGPHHAGDGEIIKDEFWGERQP